MPSAALEGRKLRDATRRVCATATALLLTLLLAPAAQAAQVQDLVQRIQGAEGGKIVGMGLVFGLAGTGDGGRFLPAMRPLAAVTQRFMDGQTIASELRDARNVALVALSARIPGHGVRVGDRVDVQVTSVGPAKSLQGGRLFLIPMTGPFPESPVYAFAEGPIVIEDAATPTTALIRNGAELVVDIRPQYINDQGRLTLIVDDAFATWPITRNLADVINDRLSPDGPNIARAADSKTVVVSVPEHERADPAGFISEMLQAYIDPEVIRTQARVVINERTGTIIVTGDVQIAPLLISHGGMTITTVTPAPNAPPPVQPVTEENDWAALDPDGRGGARLTDLLAAFNQLKVEAKDRIEIIKEIHRSGKLLGQLVME